MPLSFAYLLGQLQHALSTAQDNPDKETRERGERKAERWRTVLEGQLAGRLQVGTRTPVAATPEWVTLEVLTGGFTSGNYLAGGPLTAHETTWLAALGEVPEGAERASLNVHFLGDEGRARLQEWLQDGCYRINVPEEGALLVVHWLLERGATHSARELVEELAPFFDRLRFFPVPRATPLTSSAVVRLQPVSETISDLESIVPPEHVERMNETLRYWHPLYDQAVALFLETCDGPVPTYQRDRKGELTRSPGGAPIIEGGTLGARFPEGWRERAQALLEEYARLRKIHDRCGKPEKSKENFFQLRGLMEACLRRDLDDGERRRLRKIIASFVARRGAPGSEQHRRVRDEQKKIASIPTHQELGRVLVDRLRAFPGESGLNSLEDVSRAISAEEAAKLGVPAGIPLPDSILARLERSLEAPVEQLVRMGIIPSGEVLARVLPQITAQVSAAAFEDEGLRRLHGALYEAFRRRRSLLLLNLERQVRFEDLPWVRALGAFRCQEMDAAERAKQTLLQGVTLALTAFPQTIFPNPLLQEFRTLAHTAGLSIPFVEELAADIFMGTFSPKFLDAARISAGLLRGTLYERYYDLPFAQLSDSRANFEKLCRKVAGDGGGGSSVAHNGKIIEAQQLLTTHNLAALCQALDLQTALRGRWQELAQQCFQWICRQQIGGEWKAQLQAAKNIAYAWRQGIFFLSLAGEGATQEFIRWARGFLSDQAPAMALRMTPALRGLELVASGRRFGADGRGPRGARRLLGWVVGRHWLLDVDSRRQA